MKKTISEERCYFTMLVYFVFIIEMFPLCIFKNKNVAFQWLYSSSRKNSCNLIIIIVFIYLILHRYYNIVTSFLLEGLEQVKTDVHAAHLFCQGVHGSDTLPVSFPSGKGKAAVQRSHCWRLLHSQLTLCDRNEE